LYRKVRIPLSGLNWMKIQMKAQIDADALKWSAVTVYPDEPTLKSYFCPSTGQATGK